jgi:hypothetical protein
MKRALLVLFVLGCGRYDFEPRDDAPASGPRLRLQDNVFDDGTHQVIGAYDTLLQVPCTPTATPTGFACLPEPDLLPGYGDAACTQPIAEVSACTPAAGYAYDSNILPVAHVYQLGADVAAPAMKYVIGADGSCVVAGLPGGAYKALTEVPLATFVPMTRELGAGTRVRAQTFVAPDGVRIPGDLFDTQANGPCAVSAFDDMTVCTPYSAGVAYFYTESTCSHVVYNSNVAVDFGLELLTGGPICKSTDLNVRPVIGTIQPSQIWVDIPGSGMCVQSAPAQGWIIQDLGAPIPPAPLTRDHVSGAGSRIQLIEDAAGAATSTEYSAYDSQLGVECDPATAADGAVRCLPHSPSYINRATFSDSGCTQPLALAAYGPPPCASPLPPMFAAEYTGAACQARLHVYQPGAKYTGPIYSGSPGSCSAYVPSQDEYTIGSEIDPTTFSAITVQVEP